MSFKNALNSTCGMDFVLFVSSERETYKDVKVCVCKRMKGDAIGERLHL